MTPLVLELAADGVPVAVTCRVLGISRSGFYDARTRPPSARAVADLSLTELICEVHATSRRSYGAPSVGSSRSRHRKRIWCAASSSPTAPTGRGRPTSPNAPPAGGQVYYCAFLDAYWMVVGWSIADQMRAELVVEALQMATWRLRPRAGTILHSDRGQQYTSWFQRPAA